MELAAESARESGLELEKFRMDLIPDENTSLQHAKTVMRWNARMKKYLPTMVDATGKAVKMKNEAGRRIQDTKEKEAPQFYAKWQKQSHKRIQEVGEVEDASLKTQAPKRRKIEDDDAADDD